MSFPSLFLLQVHPYFSDSGTSSTFYYRYKITGAMLVPSLVQQIVNYPEIDKIDFSSFRSAMCGGDYLPPAVAAKFMALVPKDATFNEGYGMTETVSFILPLPLSP